MLPYYHEPLTFIATTGASILTTRADIEAFLKSSWARLKGRGWARSAFAQLHAKPLNAALAFASGLAVAYRGDGQELERIAATYVLHKTSDDWKIAVLVVHDPDTVVQLD